MLRDGAESRQADARRMRVFDFDIFFFGTGMAGSRRQETATKLSQTRLN